MKDFVICLGNVAFEVLVVLALAICLLGYGGMADWSLAATFGLLSAAFCLWVGMRLLGGGESRRARSYGDFNYRTAPALAIQSPVFLILLALVAAYLFLQVVPLPAGVVKVLNPARFAHEELLRKALGQSLPLWLSLSVDAFVSRESLTSVTLGLMGFIAGAYLACNRRRVRRIMVILMGLVLAETLYGLLEDLTGHHYILMKPKMHLAQVASGTFINRNHFASLLAIFFPVSIGWFFFRIRTCYDDSPETLLIQPSLREIFSSRFGLWIIVPVLLMVGIIQSASRGGFAAMVLGLALFFALGAKGQKARTTAWVLVLLGSLLLIYALSSDYELVLDRFDQTTAQGDGRLEIWRDALPMVRDYPLFGIGLGNFPVIFMNYYRMNALTYPDMAHNEWLEGLITLGLIGMSLLTTLLLYSLGAAFRRLRSADRDQPWLLGCWCGLVGLAAHCVCEFNLHIHALNLIAFFLLGILMGFNSSSTRRIGRRPRRSVDVDVGDEGLEEIDLPVVVLDPSRVVRVPMNGDSVKE